MIARLIWIAALIAIGAVTSIAQLDRQSRYAPNMAAHVPAEFRAFAQAHITADAIDKAEANLALAEARRLVERRPVPAEHLRLLALAQFKADDPRAATTIQLATQRGWRDPSAQEAMLRLASGTGNMEEAARRYAALLQNKASDEDMLLEFGRPVFAGSESKARAVFVDLLVSGARWQSTFLARGAQVMPADAYLAIIRASAERGARFDCQGLQSAAAILAERDAALAAELKQDAANVC